MFTYYKSKTWLFAFLKDPVGVGAAGSDLPNIRLRSRINMAAPEHQNIQRGGGFLWQHLRQLGYSAPQLGQLFVLGITRHIKGHVRKLEGNIESGPFYYGSGPFYSGFDRFDI